jgi:hypothetical protein
MFIMFYKTILLLIQHLRENTFHTHTHTRTHTHAHTHTHIYIYIYDWLRAGRSGRSGRSGDRMPVGARFFAHVQTGPGTHPTSCTMGTESFPGVKRPGRGADHSPPSSAEVTKG